MGDMTAERCALCGKPIAEGDAATLPPMPRDQTVSLHARCFEAQRAEMRAKQEVWARSPRGRMILIGSRLRGLMTAVGVALLAIGAAVPIMIYRGVRGWRLRRAVRRAIGAKSGLALVVYRAGVRSEKDVLRTYSSEWAAKNDVVLHVVELSRVTLGDPLDAAIWDQWKPDPKIPRPGVVIVPRRGRVSRYLQ